MDKTFLTYRTYIISKFYYTSFLNRFFSEFVYISVGFVMLYYNLIIPLSRGGASFQLIIAQWSPTFRIRVNKTDPNPIP